MDCGREERRGCGIHVLHLRKSAASWRFWRMRLQMTLGWSCGGLDALLLFACWWAGWCSPCCRYRSVNLAPSDVNPRGTWHVSRSSCQLHLGKGTCCSALSAHLFSTVLRCHHEQQIRHVSGDARMKTLGVLQNKHSACVLSHETARA